MTERDTSRVFAVCRVDPPSATAQHKGVVVQGGRPRFYTKKRVREATALWKAIIHSGKSPGFRTLDGAVSVSIRFTYAFPAGFSKRKRAAGAIPKPTRPDLDNLSKVILDAATAAAVWHDDGQVASLRLDKVWGDHGEVSILIEPAAAGTDTNTTPKG